MIRHQYTLALGHFGTSVGHFSTYNFGPGFFGTDLGQFSTYVLNTLFS